MEFPFPIESRHQKITPSAIFHSFLLIFRILSDETSTSSFLSQALWEWISVGGTNNNSREHYESSIIQRCLNTFGDTLCDSSPSLLLIPWVPQGKVGLEEPLLSQGWLILTSAQIIAQHWRPLLAQISVAGPAWQKYQPQIQLMQDSQRKWIPWVEQEVTTGKDGQRNL